MRALIAPLLLLVGCSAGPTSTESDGSGGLGFGGEAMGDGDFSAGGEASSGGDSGDGDSRPPPIGSGGVSSGGSGSGGEASGGSSSGGDSSGGSTASGGAPPDSDGDGVPDASDQCPDGDDTQDLNDNGDIDECEPGWCHHNWNPDHGECSVANGVRQGYCTLEYDASYQPGDCVTCPTYTYDCNDDWSDGCEIYATGAHPCFQ